MKRKIIIPFAAILFAVVAAVASVKPPQIAWYKPLGGSAQQGAITTPSNTDMIPCTVGANQCFIGAYKAYDTQVNAEAQGQVGLLKRD